MAFADALDILGGSSAPPPVAAASQGGPLQVTVRPKEQNSGFGAALDILSSDNGPPPAKETRKVSGGEAFLSGAASGVTANFADELAGVHAAGRTMLPKGINPSDMPFGDIIAAAAGAGRLG